MNSQGVITLGMHAMQVMLMVSAPLLLTSLVVGLLISIIQAATQLNEQTLSFIPKLLALIAILAIAGPWMITTLTDFLRQVIESIPGAVS
ncbi:flagellar biosynthesis protein FliQ [Derxia gummosa]|uniref:Flagellar biosynthetic protein FliQ n=1 Tax=Derxia gummosa DSM 723 TaxID=1121388 RepID=A0A8B6X5Y9_9BURK|nr:flagellar biosynthesis protein FliQ [Derxia gummosa]